MKLTTTLVLTAIALACAAPAGAETMTVWRSKNPTGQLTDAPGQLGGYCYAEVQRWADGRLYYFQSVCPHSAYNHLTIGVPLYGSPIKMPLHAHAEKIRILRNGVIQLY